MYHANFFETYIRQFQRDVEDLMKSLEKSNDNDSGKDIVFEEVILKLELDKCVYALSDIRDLLNEKLEEDSAQLSSNRHLKVKLIEKFCDKIFFTYPKDTKKSKMFFSANIQCTDIAETLRRADPLKTCAENLRFECQSFDFGLQGSFHSVDEFTISYSNYIQHKPTAWNTFFNSLFPNHTISEHIKRKCDTIFQIVFNIVHNVQKKNLLHVSLSEAIHDTCKLKNIIQILNRMGLCMSYDELGGIDMGLAQRTIDLAGQNRVPVSPIIEEAVMIHGTMDNYDNVEGILSGLGSSHDTILMLFKNSEAASCDQQQMSEVPHGLSINRRSLGQILDCQTLVKFSQRATIPTSFNSRACASDAPFITSECSEQYDM